MSQCSCKLFSVHKFFEFVGMILRKFEFNESKLNRLRLSGLSSSRAHIIQNNLWKVCKMQGNWECLISPCLRNLSKGRLSWCFIQGRVLSSCKHKNFSMDSKQNYKKNLLPFKCHKRELWNGFTLKVFPKAFKWRVRLGPTPLFFSADICGALFLVFWQVRRSWIDHLQFSPQIWSSFSFLLS